MDNFGKDIALVWSYAGLLLLGAALGAWPIMIALGNVHHDVTTACPALGFWSTLTITWAIGVLSTRLWAPLTAARHTKS